MPRIGNNGGLMGPRRTSTASSASGIWNLNEQKIAKGAGIWPEISEIVSSDPYWSNVKLLLHMEGSNGSTNFMDSSKSTLVTADFSAQISTAQSKFGGASGSFNGINDTLTFSPINIGSSQDFTLEAFIRPSSNTDHGIFYSPTPGNVQVLSLVNGKLECYMAIQSSGVVLQMTGATTVTTDTWHHVALTRNGNWAYLYLDGVLDATIGMHSGAFSITVLGFAQYRGRFNGYIDEVRITVGTARYTGSTFIPPTAPFPNTGPDLYWDNVTLLLHMNGNNGSTALIDSSSRAISFTANFDAQISTTQSKFGGSSAYFNGSGDSFSTTNTSPFEFGTGDFTVECWVYMTDLGTYNGIIDTRGVPAAFDNLVFGIWNVSGTLRLDHVSTNSSARLTATSTSVSLNTWTHVAWTRHNGTIACFVNGAKDDTTVSNSNVINPGGTTAYIGQVIDPTYFNGYIDELRITEGVARYKADFLPPDSPFSDTGPSGQPSEDPYWGDVSLLLHMDGSNGSTVFADSSNYKLVVTANGNAQISTAQRRFGTASAYFDGSGDYLSIPDNSVLEPGDSNFTWEFWVKTTTTTQYATLFSRMPSENGPSKWTLMTNRYGPTRGDLALYVGDYSASTELLLAEGYLTGAWKITDGAWHHVAVVRNGAEWAIYVDGVSRATATWAGAISNSTSPITIGRDDYYSGRDFNGYIDDFRVTKAARYTSNFTRPAAPFPNTGPAAGAYWDMTSLLLHMDGSNGSATFTDSSPNSHVITSLGGLISTAQSKFGSGSLRVQADQCIETPSSSTFSFPGDFTIEMWFKADGTQITTYNTLFELGDYTNGILLRDDSLYVNGSLRKSNVNLLNTTWRHIAVVRVGPTIKLFINGIDQGASTSAATGIINSSANPVKFGAARHTSGQPICGWIDEVRIIKGAALYTADFNPPATPFRDTSSPVAPIDPYWDNVSLLLHMDGDNGSTTFTDSSQYSRTPTSSTGALTTAKSKFGSASFFGGNAVSEGNVVWYNVYPDSIDYSYTIECWLYRSSLDVTGAGIFSFGDETIGRANIYYTTSDNRIEWEQYAIGVRYSLVVPLNSWFHFAIVRTAQSEVFFFVNGVRSGPIAGVPFGNSGKFVIWAKPSDSYIDEIRLTSMARYNANFTPPTAPFPSIDPEPVVTIDPYWANVSLLLRMDGSNGSTVFTDLSDYGHSITANGSAQVTTTDPKFGTGALALSATSSDYLSTPANSAFEFGTGDFTVECWVYLNSYHSNNGFFTFGGQGDGLALAVYFGNWTLTDVGGGGFSMGPAATLEWQHIAITRSGTIVKMFVNGTQIGSSLTITRSFLDPSNSLKIGYYYGPSYGINAKVDEFRVTKGVSRYNANFTPPTAPFPDYAAAIAGPDPYWDNVSLLLHMNGSNGSTTFTDSSNAARTITVNGSAQISTAQSKFGGSSAYFDGTGSYLQATVAGGLGSGDLTIEFWCYPLSSYGYFFNNRTDGISGDGIDTLSQAQVSTSGQFLISANQTTMNNNEWNHVAFVRSGASGTWARLINGVREVGINNSANFSGSTFDLFGNPHASGNTGYFNGYVDDLRITVGVARYTADFTPPTAPFPDAGVVLSEITYSQSSVYPNTGAATNASMTDGLQAGDQTGSNIGSSGVPWIKMDLQRVAAIDRVVIGNASNSVPPGGWSSAYTNNLDLQYSTDDLNWTTITNTGDRSAFTFLYTISFSPVTARYVKLVNNSANNVWIALTEFYALSPGQTVP